MSKDWAEIVNIKPAIWQENNRRWAAPQHYTCSYMAMFPPQLPHYFITRFTDIGDIVLDPFSGRGTTPVQAMSQGRIGIGNDLNDLAYCLTKGKVANPDLEDVSKRLADLQRDYRREDWMRSSGKMQPIPNKIRMIYHRETLRQLMYLRTELDWKNNDVDSFLAMVLMGAMHGSSPGFLSVPMPNTFSMGWRYVKKYIHENKLKAPNRNVFEVLKKRCNRSLKMGKLPVQGIAIHGDVRSLDRNEAISHGSIKMIFSSPPYLKVIKYGLYNWIRLWWLIGEHESIDKKLDDAHSLTNYKLFMKDVFEKMLPLLDPEQGIACWVIGDVKDMNLAKTVWDDVGSKIQANDSEGNISGYKLLGIVEDAIDDNEKVTRIWNAEEDKSGKATPVDRILIMCHENANVDSFLDNDKIHWEPILNYSFNQDSQRATAF